MGGAVGVEGGGWREGKRGRMCDRNIVMNMKRQVQIILNVLV